MKNLEVVARLKIEQANIGSGGQRVNNLVTYLSSLDRSMQWLTNHVWIVESSGGTSPPHPYKFDPSTKIGNSGPVTYWAVRTPERQMIKSAAEAVLAEIPVRDNYNSVESFPVSIDTIRNLADALDNKALLEALNK